MKRRSGEILEAVRGNSSQTLRGREGLWEIFIAGE
jgi:hypothetical protein